MKIGILTCMWKRPRVFEIFAHGVNRLRESYDIVPLAVGSEGEASKALCRKHQFMYLERPNKPLGRKFNEGMRCFKHTDVDYVMIMGSDDLISSELIDAYMPHMQKGDPVIGILDIYFYDLFAKSLHYWPGYGHKPDNKHRTGEPLGLARCLSREMIDRMGWHLWDDTISKGLDWSMWQKIKRLKVRPVTMKLTDINALAVDLKGELNICNRILYTCDEADHNLMNKLSKTELKLIRQYQRKI